MTDKQLEIYNRYFHSKLGFDKNKDLAIELLEQTITLLDDFNIDYTLISGTLLGYVRHNDFIPWDDDMDLIVSASLLDKLPDIINKYNSNLTFLKNKNFLIKICLKKSENIITQLNNHELINNKDKYTFPYIDLFLFKYNKNKTSLNFFNSIWDSQYFFPVNKVDFLTLKNVSIPNTPDYFLKKNYKDDYMIKLVSSNWNHRLEKSIHIVESLTMDEYTLCKNKITI